MASTSFWQKKAVGFEKKGRQYDYFPLVKETECIREETEAFLKRFHGGSVEPMLADFVRQKKLSPEKIARLREILEQAESAEKSESKRKEKDQFHFFIKKIK